MKAIGRKASTDGNGTIFGMGQISYAFQILGNYFVENELFMILHITGPKRSAADLIIFRGGSKGPGALIPLFWLVFFNRWTINSSDTCGRGVSIPLENHDCENGGYSDVKLKKIVYGFSHCAF